MAKGKPSRAFLEALKQDKKRRGDDKAGGGFKTPDWFFNKQNQADTAAPAQAPVVAAAPITYAATRAKGWRPTWVHAAGLGVVLIVVVSVSYMAGRTQHAPQLSPPTDEIRATTPQNGVLEPMERPVVTIPAPSPIPAGQSGVVPTDTAGAPEATSGRVVGMNYVVIQSYKEEKLANDAAAALKAGGLGCTVEHGLSGYSSSWFSVVGTTGFAKATTPEYQAYVKKVQAISDKFAGATKWKRFEPNPYRWR